MILSRSPGSEPHSPELRRRATVLVSIVALAMLGLVGRLWQLQVVRGEAYYEKARSNVVKKRSLPAVRGRIFDRHARVLADSRPAFDILLNPSTIEPTSLEQIADELELDSGERDLVKKRLETARARGAREPVLVLERQPHERAALARQIRYRFGGAGSIEVDDRSARQYNQGSSAAHLLGYLNQPGPIELRRLASDGYRLGDVIGRTGLERRYEPYLRGKRGIERYLENARGERVEDARAAELIGDDPFTPPVAGHDLYLSIDLDAQEAAAEALSDHAAGAVAVVEVETGRILALHSKPGFDPNLMSSGLPAAQQAELRADPRRPFVDKTLREHYPPGSTFKLVTAIAGLASSVISPEERFVCTGVHEQGGRRFHCNGVHGSVDLVAAIGRSCNVYFWRVAERLGIDPIAAVARDLGFGQVSGIGVNDEVPGRIPDRAYYKTRGGYHLGDAINASVGQGDVAVTVLQVANAYATIANGGTLYHPTLVDRIESASGTVIKETQPLVRGRMQLPARTRDAIARGTWMTVNDPKGTAFRYAGEGRVRLAGKTGSAQVTARQATKVEYEGWHPHQSHAWFAGFAPADKPTIAIAVLVEHGGSGGKEAGPIARAVVERLLAPKVDGGQP